MRRGRDQFNAHRVQGAVAGRDEDLPEVTQQVIAVLKRLQACTFAGDGDAANDIGRRDFAWIGVGVISFDGAVDWDRAGRQALNPAGQHIDGVVSAFDVGIGALGRLEGQRLKRAVPQLQQIVVVE
ncbi:hypothetical protein D3C86_1449770 [compost metagenome]